MLYIKAIIKTDFHSYFYRTIVLKKGTGNPSLDAWLFQHPEVSRSEKKVLVPAYLRREGLGIRKKKLD